MAATNATSRPLMRGHRPWRLGIVTLAVLSRQRDRFLPAGGPGWGPLSLSCAWLLVGFGPSYLGTPDGETAHPAAPSRAQRPQPQHALEPTLITDAMVCRAPRGGSDTVPGLIVPVRQPCFLSLGTGASGRYRWARTAFHKSLPAAVFPGHIGRRPTNRLAHNQLIPSHPRKIPDQRYCMWRAIIWSPQGVCHLCLEIRPERGGGRRGQKHREATAISLWFAETREPEGLNSSSVRPMD